VKEYKIPFPSDQLKISKDDLISSFSSLLILFDSVEAIQIDHLNVLTFKYLSEVLDNALLWKVCKSVKINEPQLFYFSSERFSQLPLIP
jgi:hypothetical protein